MANWYDDLPGEVWGGEKKATPAAIGGSTAPAQASTTGTGMGNPKAYYDQGMKAIGQMAAGTSPIFKSQENQATQNFGGSAMAAIGAAKQGGAQAGLSAEGIGSVAQTTAKNIEGERSKMQAAIATDKQNLATTAASNLVSGGIQGMGQQIAERQQTQAEKTAAETQKQTDWARMLQTYDPSTPDGLKSLQTGYTQMFGGNAPDLNTLIEQRKYTQTKQEQDVKLGGIGVSSAEQTLKDQNQASVMSRIASGYSVDRINSELGTDLTPEEYEKMRENTDTYFTSKGIDMQEASLYGYTDASGNHVAGNLEIAAGQFGLQGKSYEDQKKELFGYTDENGKVITGKYEALSDSAKQQADSSYGYDTTDADGNTVHIKGTLELANSADAINRQGLTLQEAQIKGYVDPTTGQWVKGSVQVAAEKAGMEVSSLYGYTYNKDTGEVVTDPAKIAALGNKAVKVDGALVLAQKTFGLNESSYDLQYAEMYGKSPDGKAVIGTDGLPVKGRFELLSAANQREANQLYGYDVDGKHIAGTLEIMDKETQLKERGMTIEEAQSFGYDYDTLTGKILTTGAEKGDAYAAGTLKHAYGTFEIETQKMDIIRSDAEAQKKSEAGKELADYFGTMKIVSGWNPDTDKKAQALLKAYWNTIPGNEGKAVDKQWAQNQFTATTISQTDAAIANLEQEKWYKDLQNGTTAEKKRAEQIRQVAGLAAMLSITQGAVPVYNETGDVVGLNDSQGNLIWGADSATSAATYNEVTWNSTPIVDKWEYFEKNNAAYPELTTKQEWIDAGMPHPMEGIITKTIESEVSKLPPTVRKSADMFLDTSTPEVKKVLTDVYDGIVAGTTTDAFKTDADGGTVSSWVELNKGRKISIGDKTYTVDSYVSDNRAGDRAAIVLTDSNGVPLKIEGTKSERKDSGQAATDAAASAAFVQGVTGFLYDGVQEIKNGDYGAAALSFLTGGLSGIIKKWQKRRK